MAKNREKPRIVTRKHLVGLQRERYYNRLLMIGTIIILAAVVLLVSWSWIQDTLLFPAQTVATVEDTKITGAEFIARAKLYRKQLINAYISTYGEAQYMMQLFGSDPNTANQISQQYTQQLNAYKSQLDPAVVGQLAINELVDDEMVKREAAAMGITVSDGAVTQRIQRLFAYFPSGTPTPLPEMTTAPTSTLSALQLSIVSATPTATVTTTPSETPTGAATATGTPTSEPTAESSATPTLAPSATATPYTLEGFNSALADYVNGIGVTEEDLRDAIYTTLLREAITDQITADLPHTQDQVWARHILVATEDEAKAVLTRLNAGEDWNALAAELSLDTSNKDTGGDLGWFPKDQMVAPFANVAFAMQIGEISEPVQSSFGWHIIQVLGHEDRPLSSDEYQQLRQKMLQDFIQTLHDKYASTINEAAWKAMSPTLPEIPADYQLPQTQQ